MIYTKSLPWHSPLKIAAGIPATEKNWVLLYSSQKTVFSGHCSYLALRSKEEIRDSSFQALASVLTSSETHPLENAWFGYLGYELNHCLETIPGTTESWISLPPLWMTQYQLILQFDHQKKKLTAFAASEKEFAHIPAPDSVTYTAPQIQSITSNMTKTTYLKKVTAIQEAIRRGDLCQANLTRKFFGSLTCPSPLALFEKLCEISPAPYSAFLKADEYCILSSSPERFLHVTADGQAETRPIKGSARRDKDPEKDMELKEDLYHSTKDRAENLMIVDLSRNDLSRTCQIGSVQVKNLYEVTSYATIHHMASTIQGIKNPSHSTLDLVKNCFPPGSMTGTPKIKAMELCTQLEETDRGVYSGAMGWFGGDGSCDLSVVIRTLILHKDRFEFQVGGAIIHDSEPEKEWEETLTKATGLCMALGISTSELARL